MVVWGLFWGALFGLLAGQVGGSGPILGAILGGLAGWTLRSAVERRVGSLLDARGAAASSPARSPSPEPLAPIAPPAAKRTNDTEVAQQASIEVALPLGAEPSAPVRFSLPPAAEAAAPRAPTALEAAVDRARTWLLGGNTVARLGAVVLFIGLAFLARLAIERALFPPQLRLAAIALVAVGMLVAGFRLRERRQGYALTLQGAGVAILYLTVFAALRLYGLVSPLAAFALLVAVCALSALLALLQDARALAVIGAVGGFATPLLVSTGQGDHVVLFGYYTVLNVGILGIAWKRDWRLLNLVGFGFTFGIATFWGVLRYRPDEYASTQGFLVVFWLLYVAIAVLFAWRRAPRLTDYVDATLVFGVPLIGFGLQAGLVRDFEYGLAWSALAVASFYLGSAALLARRRLTQLRLLVECFVALGVIFASLAIPFALDASWTAAAWALEGAAAVWIGARQQRRAARAFGLLLQLGACIAFVQHLGVRPPQPVPVLNADFVGAVLIAGAAIFSARVLAALHGSQEAAQRRGYDAFEGSLAVLLFLHGFLWWLLALTLEVTRRQVGADGEVGFAVAPANRLFPLMAGYVLSATIAARVGLARSWPVATWPAYASLPVMLAAALAGAVLYLHLFEHFGWLCWPVAVAAHLVALRALDAAPSRWWVAVHAGGVYLLVLLAGSLGVDLIDRARLWHTSWAPAAALLACALVLHAVGRASVSSALTARWPLDRFAAAYGWFGLLPVAALTALGALTMTLTQRGDAAPLPYLPLVNPTDLAFLLALAALWGWRVQLSTATWALPAWMRDERVAIRWAGAVLFLWLNSVWLRVAHHYFGVAWEARRLFDSFVVQAGYALLWSAAAVALTVFASRRGRRAPWLAGAALLAATVVKLFLVDLSNAGGGERIVAFVGVGALMLFVGYVAPLPPPPPRTRATDEREAT
jgi:uncharacterized membrane protein